MTPREQDGKTASDVVNTFLERSDGEPGNEDYRRLREAIFIALADARRAVWEEAAKVAEQAIPRAHTYASENADIYRAQDDAKRIIIKAIRAQAQAKEGA